MKLINIVDRVDPVNFGIWNAAVNTAGHLFTRHGIASELWYPMTNPVFTGRLPEGVEARAVRVRVGGRVAEEPPRIGLGPGEAVIVTHGCWQYPTRWGRYYGRHGYRWLAVPHGMLEPWSMNQKAWRKRLYFRLMEGRFLAEASACRAVSGPEAERLRGQLDVPVVHVPNSVETPERSTPVALTRPLRFLFLGRLNHKKGVRVLLEGWEHSRIWEQNAAQLIIAGPDDGEESAIRRAVGELASGSTITLYGPAFGEAKQALLATCHYFVLPSFSEGFPTSVLEAMRSGLVPLVSDGCNFPEILESPIALRANPCRESVATALRGARALAAGAYAERSRRAMALVRERYAIPVVAAHLARLVSELRPGKAARRAGFWGP